MQSLILWALPFSKQKCKKRMVENFANKQNLNYMYQDKEQFYTLLLYCLVILGSAGGLLLLQYYSSLKNKGSLGVAIA